MSSRANNEEERCTSVAWHGEQCKNKKKASEETCAWHAPGFINRAKANRIEADSPVDLENPHRWNVRCKATNTGEASAGERCGQNAVRGLDICAKHGGGHPVAREMGKRVMENRIERHRLGKLADKYGLDELNPLQAMQKLVQEVLMLKEHLYEQIANMDAEDWTYTDRIGVEQARQVFQMYERAVERSSRLLVDLGKLNIDDRLAKVSEKQAEVVAVVMEKVLTAMELDEERRDEAKTLLGQEFRKLELVHDSEHA